MITCFRRLVCSFAFAFCVTIVAPGHAAFHFWNLSEVFTNSSGTLQFIELIGLADGQNIVGGQQIGVNNVAGTTTNTFTLPAGNLPPNTVNRNLLFGTAGLQAAGGPAPDYIIPNNFLFSGGGTINFFGQNSGPYSALPTDGVSSRIWGAGNAANSPTNFAGQSGVVGVPEPGTTALLVTGGLAILLMKRRRRAG